MNDPSPSRVFVYGTLKRGQCREQCWPTQPVSIQVAEVRGTLYDLGPFPALREGDDRVSGEVWEFEPDDMPLVLATTDAIEGYAGLPSDLYRRIRVVATIGGEEVAAWSYVLYSDPPESQRIDSVPAQWPRGLSSNTVDCVE